MIDDSGIFEFKHISSLNDPELLYNIAKGEWCNENDIEFINKDGRWYLMLNTGEWIHEESIIAAIKDTPFWYNYIKKIDDGMRYYFEGDILKESHNDR